MRSVVDAAARVRGVVGAGQHGAERGEDLARRRVHGRSLRGGLRDAARGCCCAAACAVARVGGGRESADRRLFGGRGQGRGQDARFRGVTRCAAERRVAAVGFGEADASVLRVEEDVMVLHEVGAQHRAFFERRTGRYI